jgi:hypothetical protein
MLVIVLLYIPREKGNAAASEHDAYKEKQN